jgi:hypothetical protein
MEKTAVEFLVETFVRHFGTGWLADETIKKEIEHANKMFEKQIIDASNESYLNSELIKRSVKNKNVFSVGEQYYNETFKKQKQ